MMLFAVAVGVNAGSVALQQRTQLFTRRFGARAWHVHLGLVMAAWAAFVLTLIDHGVHVRWTLPHALHPAGVAVLAVSAALCRSGVGDQQCRLLRTGGGIVPAPEHHRGEGGEWAFPCEGSLSSVNRPRRQTRDAHGL